MIPPGQRPTSLRPSPAPSNPAPPRRGSIAQRRRVTAPPRISPPSGSRLPADPGADRSPRISLNPLGLRVQDNRIPWVYGSRDWITQRVKGTQGIRGNPGEGLTQRAKNRGFGGPGDSFTFRAGKAKIDDFFKSTRISESSKPYPSDKRDNCHHPQKEPLKHHPAG